VQHLAWSPDGASLAYDTDTSIWRVDLATETPVRLTTDDPSHGVESWQPSWSPDGNTIAYSRFQTCFRCTAIWLINSDGTSPRQIYDDGNFQATASSSTRTPASAASTSPAKTAPTRAGSHEPADTSRPARRRRADEPAG